MAQTKVEIRARYSAQMKGHYLARLKASYWELTMVELKGRYLARLKALYWELTMVEMKERYLVLLRDFYWELTTDRKTADQTAAAMACQLARQFEMMPVLIVRRRPREDGRDTSASF